MRQIEHSNSVLKIVEPLAGKITASLTVQFKRELPFSILINNNSTQNSSESID